MRKNERTKVYLILMVFTFVTVVPFFLIQGMTATNDPSVWFYHDFESYAGDSDFLFGSDSGPLSSNPPLNLFYRDQPALAFITNDMQRGGRCLAVSNDFKLLHFLDETGVRDDSVRQFVYQMDVKFDRLDFIYWLGFGEWNMVRLEPERAGQINSTEGFKGRLKEDMWANLAIAVNKDTNSYDVYVDRVKVQEDMLLSGPFDMNRFTFYRENPQGVHTTSRFYLDNYIAYEGVFTEEVPPSPGESSYWFENDFNKIEAQSFPQQPGNLGLDYPYQAYHWDWGVDRAQVAIVPSDRGQGNMLQITKTSTPQERSTPFKLFRWTADNTAPLMGINNLALDCFTYEFDIKLNDFEQKWVFGFNDRTLLTIGEGTGRLDYSYPTPKLEAGQWHHLAIEVHKETSKCTIYLDGSPVRNYTVGGINAQTYLDRFFIMSDWSTENYAPSTLWLDHIKAYPHAYQDLAGNLPETAYHLPVGQTVSGKIISETEEDWYWFQPEQDGHYFIESNGSSNFVGVLYREDSVHSGAVMDRLGIGDDPSAGVILQRLSAGQGYFLKIIGENGETGPYSFCLRRGEDNTGAVNPVGNVRVSRLTADRATLSWDLPEGNFFGLTYTVTDSYGGTYQTYGNEIDLPYTSGKLCRFSVVAKNVVGNESSATMSKYYSLIGINSQAGKEYDVFVDSNKSTQNKLRLFMEYPQDILEVTDVCTPQYGKISLQQYLASGQRKLPDGRTSCFLQAGRLTIETDPCTELTSGIVKSGNDLCFTFRAQESVSAGIILTIDQI